MEFAYLLKNALQGQTDGQSSRTVITDNIESLVIIPPDVSPFVISSEMLALEALEIELVNPYKGLRAFQQSDSKDFHGGKS